MIRVRYMGQLGNLMFEHVIAKILAERTGQAYDAQPWLDKAERPLKWNMTPYLVPTSTPGQRLGVGSYNINVLHWFDINNVKPGWEVDAVGFFQRWELLSPYRDKIRNEWLPIRHELNPERGNYVWTDDDAVYIHVRRTDYLGDHLSPERNCQATSLEEYAACLRKFPEAKSAFIVTDDYSDPFLPTLEDMLWKDFGLESDLCPGSTWDWDYDWLRLASCKNLIMSQSTYSWWAAFLGRPTKIVCPVFPNTLWGNGYKLIGPPKDGRDFPNLEVTDDPEKEWIWLHE